jgi:hypothetical protein
MKVKYRTAILGALTLILSACGSTSKIPPQQPITSGIFEKQPSQSPLVKVVGGPKAKLAVLLTKNTAENTRYILYRFDVHNKEYSDKEWTRAYGETLDPVYPLSSIANSLKKKFGNVYLLDNIDQFNKESFDTLALVDTYYEPLNYSGIDYTTARVSVTFYDNQLRYIGTAGSQEYKSKPESFCCWTLQETVDSARAGFQPLEQALKELNTKLNELVETKISLNQ